MIAKESIIVPVYSGDGILRHLNILRNSAEKGLAQSPDHSRDSRWTRGPVSIRPFYRR